MAEAGSPPTKQENNAKLLVLAGGEGFEGLAVLVCDVGAHGNNSFLFVFLQARPTKPGGDCRTVNRATRERNAKERAAGPRSGATGYGALRMKENDEEVGLSVLV